MAQERISLSKTLYDNYAFENFINTSFSTATVVNPPPPELAPLTIDSFFSNYETLFYQIPQTGDTNSHEYLIKKSSEYIGAVMSQNPNEALIAEITELRLENIKLQKESADLIRLQVENETLKNQLSSKST